MKCTRLFLDEIERVANLCADDASPLFFKRGEAMAGNPDGERERQAGTNAVHRLLFAPSSLDGYASRRPRTFPTTKPNTAPLNAYTTADDATRALLRK